MNNHHLEPGVREAFIEHAIDAYKRCPNNRAYALDDRSELALAALAVAAHQALFAEKNRTSWDRQEIADKVFKPLLALIPSLSQERPGPEVEPPKIPVDPVSGRTAANPWAKQTLNLTEQGAIHARDPQLAAYLKETANGISYTYLLKLREEKEKREHLRKLVYTEKEHAKNPYTGTNITERGEFARTHDPVTKAFYEREGKMGFELPWVGPGPNLTQLSEIQKSDPGLRVLVDYARTVVRDWDGQDLSRLAQARKQAEEAHRRAEQLAGVR